MWFLLISMYVLLTFFFVVDVLRQPGSVLSGAGKALWILALVLVPVLTWLVYGIWRMRRDRGLSGF